jgi:GST-like protein
MWQMAGLGPMSGQNGHFRHQAPAPADPYASERYFGEMGRLYAVMDHRLRDRDYVAGDYTIVDMACHPWIATHEVQGMDMNDYPHLTRWFAQVGERAAVKRAYAGADHGPSRRLSEPEHRRLYQQTAQLIRDAYARMDAEGE